MTTTTYVQAAVNIPSITGVFDYSVPARLQSQAGVGKLAVAPFGNRVVQAVILRYVPKPSVPEVKELLEVVDGPAAISEVQIALAEQVAADTIAPLAAIVGLFIPPGLERHADQLYALAEELEVSEGAGVGQPPAGSAKGRLLRLLRERGPLRGRQLDARLRGFDWRPTARLLVRDGALRSSPILPPPSVRPRFLRTAELAASPRAVHAAIPDLGATLPSRTRRQKALRALLQQPGAMNVSWLYAESGCTLADLHELVERDLIVLRETEIWRDPLTRSRTTLIPTTVPLRLNPEQDTAWKRIEDAFREAASGRPVGPMLLEGVTGSGKTELYIRAAGEAIHRGRQAIVLVPEIALTPQTVQRFQQRFPGQVGLVHSRLSDGERYDTWRRAREGRLSVVIGPRSALFSPLPAPGLIVLDECHDPSYHQAEPPFYDAASVAERYASLAGAVLLLGSATPTIVQRYQAEIGGSQHLRILKRATVSGQASGSVGLPPVEIVDLREELKSGNRSIFSRLLLNRLAETLERGEQAILFLNRRGTATYIFCRSCGWSLKCPRCQTPMTLHTGEGESLLCHHCGYSRKRSASCDSCGSTSMTSYGLGSEKVEAEVLRQFPRARTLRWDWDTTRQRDAHEVILAHFAAGRADVLVGTQMLAKGLDVPMVTLVGIVLADLGLNLPDPFAVERAFHTLTHAAGRAGRGERGGNVVLQTFLPTHHAIQAAAAHDVDGFYRQELQQRRRLGYPPFSRLVRLEYRHHDAAVAEQNAQKLAAELEAKLRSEPAASFGAAGSAESSARPEGLIGPAPCFYRKLNGQYRWQILLRGANPVAKLASVAANGWRIEADPTSLL